MSVPYRTVREPEAGRGSAPPASPRLSTTADPIAEQTDQPDQFAPDRPPMDISDGRLRPEGDFTELSASIGGYRVWFRVPTVRDPELRADPFLAVALVAAMRSGRPIRIDRQLPISPTLLANVDRLQRIFRYWFPACRPVKISGGNTQPVTSGFGTGALFSGGVDSCFTLLRGRGEIAHSLFVDRVDTGKKFDSSKYHAALPRLSAMVEHHGSALLQAATNAKEFAHAHHVHWHEAVGGGLAAVGMVARLRELRVPASSPWSDLGPFGTHPVTDPLWSTEGLSVVHDGTDYRRMDKLRAVADDPVLVDGLRVCMDGADGNCGRCEKCIRTAVGLRAIGRTSNALPPLDLSLVPGLHLRQEGIFLDWLEILDELPPGHDPRLRRALERLVRRYRTRRALKALWNALAT